MEFATRFAVSRARYEFASSALNQIDFIAILPYYLELLAKGIAIPGLSVLRVTRLARVFRLLKVSKDSLSLLGETMARSARPLYILGFLLMISLVMFSSVMYYAERGEFDTTQGKWMRTTGFSCDYVCSPETRKLTTPYLECTYDGEARTMYFEKFTIGPFPDLCERVTEYSPYQSIMHSLWWALVTMATVGYGDMYPRSLVGYLLAGLTQMCGILVIALPITVIGSNFSTIYESLGSINLSLLEGAEPTPSVVARRLHASSQGSTHAPVTQHWLTVLTQEWDIDVMYKELLPCKPPAPRKDPGTPAPTPQRLSAKEEFAAFIEGKDLTSDATPKSASRGQNSLRLSLALKTPKDKDGLKKERGTLAIGKTVRFDSFVPELDADTQRYDALVDIANRLLVGLSLPRVSEWFFFCHTTLPLTPLTATPLLRVQPPASN